MLKNMLLVLSFFTFATSSAYADVAANKKLVLEMMTNVFAARDASAVDTYITEDYIQRNPMIPSGSAPIKKFLSKPVDPNAPKSPPNVRHRIIGEGDLIATHSTLYNFGPKPLVVFDVFRIENGRIAEHWDNMTPLADKPNPSGRTQTDGETEITDLDKTVSNKAKVLELVDRMFIKGEKIDVTQYINPNKYIQHNSMAGDGLEGLGKLMKEMAAKGIKMIYSKVGISVAEGNFVLVGSEGTLGDRPTAFYDLFRLEDGLIVEHWDVIAEIQTDNLPEGYPGKF